MKKMDCLKAYQPHCIRMSFPNKSFNNVLPGEPVCICIKGVYSWYTEAQIREYIERKITLEQVKITDIYIELGNFTNDVYVCFSDWFVERGVSYPSYMMQDMTETFAYGASFAILAPVMIDDDDTEWTCYYEDSILSYSDIMKMNEPITDSYVNVIVGVETDDLCDNDTVSTHSSMPELIDAADADAEEDADEADEEEDDEEDDEEEDDEEDEEEDDEEGDEEEDDEEDDDEEDEEEDADEDEDKDDEDPEKYNVEHNISQALDWVVLKLDLNDTKTVIRLLIALNYLNVFVNLVLLMCILQSL